MSISFQIPPALEEELRKQLGDLDQAAKEALAIQSYRTEKLSIGQIAELLELTVYEAEGFMKEHGVPATFGIADLEQDRATLKQLFQP